MDAESEECEEEPAPLTASPWGMQESGARGLWVVWRAGGSGGRKVTSGTANRGETESRHGTQKQHGGKKEAAGVGSAGGVSQLATAARPLGERKWKGETPMEGGGWYGFYGKSYQPTGPRDCRAVLQLHPALDLLHHGHVREGVRI